MLTSPLLPPIGCISLSTLYSLQGETQWKGPCYELAIARVVHLYDWGPCYAMLCYAMLWVPGRLALQDERLASCANELICHAYGPTTCMIKDTSHEFEKQSRYLVSYHSVHRSPRALTEEISRGVNWWLLGSTPIFFSSKFCTNFLNWDLILNQLVHIK